MTDSGPVSYPPFPARRGGVSGGPWWTRSWARTLEEAAYGEEDLRRGRRLARAGSVGSIALTPGGFVASVLEDSDAWTVQGTVERLGEEDQQAVAEVLGSGVGRVAALLAGDLPLEVVEALEEVGVELLPYAGELAWSCTCRPWIDPCRHALAVATQVGWLMRQDPWVLLTLRGLPREGTLARVRPADDADLREAVAAAERARALLADWGPEVDDDEVNNL